MFNVIDYTRRNTHACNCIGPQNGEPLCPCKMQSVVIKNGRYVLPEQDLGPVRTVDKEPQMRSILNDLNLSKD